MLTSSIRNCVGSEEGSGYYSGIKGDVLHFVLPSVSLTRDTLLMKDTFPFGKVSRKKNAKELRGGRFFLLLQPVRPVNSVMKLVLIII
jgi:hypothetical protein